MDQRAVRLIPAVEKIETPQCEAMRTNPYANDTDKTDFQCKWSSRYRIDGRNLCSKHAGIAALEILIKGARDADKDHP